MKRAQIWSIDLVIAVMIFTIGIVFFFVYALNYGQDAQSELEGLQYDAVHLAETLKTTGYPINWSANDVIIPGIIDNGQVNESKLAELAALTDANYDRTRTLFATRYHWYLNFSQPMIIQNITRSTIGQTSTNPANVFRVQRITVYRNKPVVMNIYLWE